jgi:hypothetical protein
MVTSVSEEVLASIFEVELSYPALSNCLLSSVCNTLLYVRISKVNKSHFKRPQPKGLERAKKTPRRGAAVSYRCGTDGGGAVC